MRNHTPCWWKAKSFPCFKAFNNFKSNWSHHVREVGYLLQIPISVCATVGNTSQHYLGSHPIITFRVIPSISGPLRIANEYGNLCKSWDLAANWVSCNNSIQINSLKQINRVSIVEISLLRLIMRDSWQKTTSSPPKTLGFFEIFNKHNILF